MQVTVAKTAGLRTSPQNGFTTVELMVTLALMAIVITLAYMSYQATLEKRRVTSIATEAQAFILRVQGESIERNQTMTVSYSRTGDHNWCLGAVAGTTPCDCTETNAAVGDYCGFEGAAMVVTNLAENRDGRIKSMTGDGAFTFDPASGMLMNLDDSLQLDLRSNSEAYRLALVVSKTGLTMLCSQDSAHQVPGYDVCAVTDSVDEA